MDFGGVDFSWLILFLPTWAVVAFGWFALVSRLKKSSGPKTGKVLDGAAVVLSVCCATAIMASLDCYSLIQVPFFDPACHQSDLRLADLVDFRLF